MNLHSNLWYVSQATRLQFGEQKTTFEQSEHPYAIIILQIEAYSVSMYRSHLIIFN